MLENCFWQCRQRLFSSSGSDVFVRSFSTFITASEFTVSFLFKLTSVSGLFSRSLTSASSFLTSGVVTAGVDAGVIEFSRFSLYWMTHSKPMFSSRLR